MEQTKKRWTVSTWNDSKTCPSPFVKKPTDLALRVEYTFPKPTANFVPLE
jgi:hypothetical protein